jgi:diadenosine tetraphosphate (Ap4A) HIT family hydrolase
MFDLNVEFCMDKYICIYYILVPGIDSQPMYEFGHCRIGSKQVFYKTALSYAFVNIKPVKPGHILTVQF